MLVFLHKLQKNKIRLKKSPSWTFFFVITGIRTNNVIRYLLNFIVVVGISSALTYLLAPELLSDSGKSFEEIAKLKLAFLSASITLIIITGQSIIKLH